MVQPPGSPRQRAAHLLGAQGPFPPPDPSGRFLGLPWGAWWVLELEPRA